MEEHESKDKKRKVTIENTKFTRPNNTFNILVFITIFHSYYTYTN